MRFTFSIPRATPNDMQSKTRKRPKRCHGMLPKSRESSPNMAEGSSSLIIFPVIESAKKFQDPADDDAVTDCDSERSDNGDQPDECAKF